MDLPRACTAEVERGSVVFRRASPVDASIRLVTRAFAVWAELSRLRPDEAVRRIAETDAGQHAAVFDDLSHELGSRLASDGVTWLMPRPSAHGLHASWFADPADRQLKLQSAYVQEEHRLRVPAEAGDACVALGALRALYAARVRDLAARNVRLLREVLLWAGRADPDSPPTDVACREMLGLKQERRPAPPPAQIAAA